MSDKPYTTHEWSMDAPCIPARVTASLYERDRLAKRVAELEREWDEARAAHAVMAEAMHRMEGQRNDARYRAEKAEADAARAEAACALAWQRMCAERAWAFDPIIDPVEALLSRLDPKSLFHEAFILDSKDAEADAAALREALEAQAGDTPGPESRPCWCNEPDAHCRNRSWCLDARRALASDAGAKLLARVRRMEEALRAIQRDFHAAHCATTNTPEGSFTSHHPSCDRAREVLKGKVLKGGAR